MKSSIMTSAALATLVLMGSANAEILPSTNEGLPNDSIECATWAGTDASRQTLCVALQSCETNASTSEGTALDCITDAQLAYKGALTPASARSGYVPEYVPEEKESVSTNPGNSDYERIGDQKGWKNAQQGGE